MILHLTTLDGWLAHPDRPYATASLALEGFIHCSPEPDSPDQQDSPVLTVANDRFAHTQGPLMVLLIDEDALDSPVRWEAAVPAPPPGTAATVLFPHIYGPVNRSAVVGMLEVQRDHSGKWAKLIPWS
ncbi:DUF952 domain-containing protein [Streptacidiphilus sp. N1-12]|uniref:DUF952 domain-containing protein n=2 Tax=Streptacidiphilus alkalitolerans TaxID=3342712 RepID=A0ABV6W8K2_9ACTN